jgi:hypothetical protein
MISADKGTSFLKDFRDFIAYLQNLWGIMAGISVVFPLSNSFVKVIPVQLWDKGGGFAFFSPEWITIIATLLSLFVMLWTYGQRRKFKEQRETGSIRRQALFSFSIGITAMIFYLVVYVLVQSDVHYSVMGWDSDDLRRVIFDVIMLFLYSVFFTLVTRAFMFLGMIEFFGQKGGKK